MANAAAHGCRSWPRTRAELRGDAFELEAREAGVEAAATGERVVAALLDDPAMLHDDDPPRGADRCEPVGDDDGRAADAGGWTGQPRIRPQPATRGRTVTQPAPRPDDRLEEVVGRHRESERAASAASGSTAGGDHLPILDPDHLEEIVELPGLDMIQWGGTDYSMNVGRAGARTSPEMKAVERKVFETAVKMGVPPRAEIGSVDEAKYFLDMGVRHFNIGTDIAILYSWLKQNGEGLRKVISGG